MFNWENQVKQKETNHTAMQEAFPVIERAYAKLLTQKSGSEIVSTISFKNSIDSSRLLTHDADTPGYLGQSDVFLINRRSSDFSSTVQSIQPLPSYCYVLRGTTNFQIYYADYKSDLNTVENLVSETYEIPIFEPSVPGAKVQWAIELKFIKHKTFLIRINDLTALLSGVKDFWYDYRISFIPNSFNALVIKDFSGGFYKSQSPVTPTQFTKVILDPFSLHKRTYAYFIVDIIILPRHNSVKFPLTFDNIKYKFLNDYDLIDNLVTNCKQSQQIIESKQPNTQEDEQESESENDISNYSLTEEHQELKWLFDESWGTDIVITVNEKQIMAHKCILAARSLVFRDLFNPNLKGTKSEIVVKDFSYETMISLIKFAYTRQVHNFGEESIVELIKAAQKYNMQPLVLKCEDILLTYLNDNNVFELAKLADSIDAKKLKSQAIDLIISNVDNLSQEKLMSLKSDSLYSEILFKLIKQKF